MIIFGRHLSIELINGCGFFLEFADSRAVWTINNVTEEVTALPFQGILLYLPFIMVTYGRVYSEQD
jgi:hypothetical protein